jgi:uncharacterized protein (DUF488 family)
MPTPLYTVGHSNRSLGEFLDLLHGADITILVDIRARGLMIDWDA